MTKPQPTGAAAPQTMQGVLCFVALDELHDSPTQQRDEYDPDYIAELGTSIKASGRNNSAVLARPHPSGKGLEIVFGHCRKRACEWAGLPAAWTEIRDMTDLEVELAQISENLNRKAINPLAEARGFLTLMRNHGLKAEDMKEKFGKSRSYVYGSLSLLKLCQPVVDAMKSGLPVGVAQKIASYSSDSLQQRALARVRQLDGAWLSERDAKKLLNNEFTIRLEKAPFDLKDAALYKDAGACTECPNLAANNPELADLPADTCVNKDCFDIKCEEHWQHVVMQLQDDGHNVLQDSDAISEFRISGHVPLTSTYKFGDKMWPVAEMVKAWPEDHPRASLTYVAPDGEEPRGYITTSDLNALMVALKLIAAPAAPSPAAATTSDQANAGSASKEPLRDPREAWPFPTGRTTSETSPQTPEFDVAAARWDAALLPAILRAAAARERTTDDLRLVVANTLDFAHDAGIAVAAELMGRTQQAELGAEEWLRVTLPDLTADQLGLLIVLMGIACDAPSFGEKQIHGRIAMAERFGVDVRALAPQSDESADDEEDDYTPDLVVQSPKPKVAKYRNAATGETWSGRGLQPRWLKVAIAGGAKLSDFVVEGAAA